MGEKYPIACANCGTRLDTENFHNAGHPLGGDELGHKDPRTKNGEAVCSLECSDEIGGGNTVYPTKANA